MKRKIASFKDLDVCCLVKPPRSEGRGILAKESKELRELMDGLAARLNAYIKSVAKNEKSKQMTNDN